MASLVLAGGSSRRMGQSKAEMTWDGEAWLVRVCRAAHEAAPPVIVVGGEQEIGPPWTQWLADKQPGAGPLAAICQGMAFAGPGRHLALACDMPLLDATSLSTLWSFAPDTQLTLVRLEGWWQPLCGVYSYELLPTLQAAIARGETRLSPVVESLIPIPFDEVAMAQAAIDPVRFANINTPQELQRFMLRLDPVGR